MSGAGVGEARAIARLPICRARIGAILNPASGRRDMRRVVDEIARHVEGRGGRLEIRTTEAPGHAAELASELAETSEAILVVGGDGTVAEVVNGLRGPRTPIAVYPTGTENLLARSLGMPRDPEAMATRLCEGTEVVRDLAEANGRLFASTLGVGFDAECVRRLTRIRRGHISHLSYAWPILRTFLFHRFPKLRVEIDGETVFDDQGFVVMGVTSRYAVGLHVVVRARNDDGLCDLIAFPCRSRRRLLAHAVRALLGRPEMGDGVVYRQFRRACVFGDSGTPVQADGDDAGDLPLAVASRPSSIAYLLEHATRGEPR